MQLLKPVTRELQHVMIQGKSLVVRIMHDGIYVKRKGEHWDSAYHLPWETVYYQGGKLKAQEVKPERVKRLVSRGLLTIGR